MGCEASNLTNLDNPNQDIPQKVSKSTFLRKPKNAKVHAGIIAATMHENIARLPSNKSAEDVDFIQRAVSKHFFLFKLSRHERREVANAMELYQTKEGEYVFEQGQPASMFFILKEGQVQIEVAGEPVKTMYKGSFFGQLAIIYSSPRSASVKALTTCKFWCLSQSIFLQLQREMVKLNYKLAKPYVNRLPIFSFLTGKQRDQVSYHMNALKYEAKETIFKAGDDATSFYIIMQGMVEIDIPGKPPLKLKSGDSFGESCLKSGSIRSGSARCIEKTQLMAIGAENLKNCLGEGHSEVEILHHNIIKWALRRSTRLNFQSTVAQQKFIHSGQITTFKDGEIIAEEGAQDTNMYICLEGRISGIDKGVIINEEAVQEEDFLAFKAQKALVKEEEGAVFVINFNKIPKSSAKIKKATNKSIVMNGAVEQMASSKTCNMIKNNFKDLYILSKLGQGQMGRVFLVENRKTEQRYALKCVEKNQVIKLQMEKYIVGQKQVLDQVDHPLIVKLFETYKDSHFIYFLLNYIEGGDFFDFLADAGQCQTSVARFYIACLILSIQYLHKNNILYRDLKPQNATLDANGYLHLIDLGTAKELSAQAECGMRTFTIIGTPHYMAPQVFQAKGYSFPVDIWSLGIVLYEMVCGLLPFGTYTDDPISVYKQIEKNQIKFPKSYEDDHGKELIRRLLMRNSSQRSVWDFSQIKYMDYFKNFNWKLLETKEMVAPVRPKLSDAKERGRCQYLLNYLQKEKLKMDKPIPCKDETWDEVF